MCGGKFSHEELTWAEYRDILDVGPMTTGERFPYQA